MVSRDPETLIHELVKGQPSKDATMSFIIELETLYPVTIKPTVDHMYTTSSPSICAPHYHDFLNEFPAFDT